MWETCPDCSGVGAFDLGDCEDGIMEECALCKGEGQIYRYD